MLRCSGAAIALLLLAPVAQAQVKASLTLRGQEQPLRLYGPSDGPPVVLASGDGGFVHLVPEVAAFLGAQARAANRPWPGPAKSA